MPFQSQVNAQPAPGLEGGWASANPHFSLLTPGNGDITAANYAAWVAGAAGVIIGRFGFANPLTGQVTSGAPGTNSFKVGFVHRYQPAIITPWLGQATMALYSGQELDIIDSGDVWCRFAAGAAIGQKAFASLTDGGAIAGTTGATINGAAVTANTTNGSPNLAALSGPLVAGQSVSGTGIPAGAYIVTGAAAGGTAVMSANATATATGVSVTNQSAVETRWYVDSVAASGELAKLSTRG